LLEINPFQDVAQPDLAVEAIMLSGLCRPDANLGLSSIIIFISEATIKKK
jgi:hypothetical protein